jgi:hypothetical protein
VYVRQVSASTDQDIRMVNPSPILPLFHRSRAMTDESGFPSYSALSGSKNFRPSSVAEDANKANQNDVFQTWDAWFDKFFEICNTSPFHAAIELSLRDFLPLTSSFFGRVCPQPAVSAHRQQRRLSVIRLDWWGSVTRLVHEQWCRRRLLTRRSIRKLTDP